MQNDVLSNVCMTAGLMLLLPFKNSSDVARDVYVERVPKCSTELTKEKPATMCDVNAYI